MKIIVPVLILFRTFQYKILNNILYTNTKLCKIGFRADDLCTFCEAERETLYHLLYQCTYARQFWNDFELYWFRLSNQVVHLTLENVLFGMLSTQCPSHTLLNYFIIIGKLFLWDCRRKQIHPKIQGYQNKIAIKYEIERKINKKNFFEKKWIFKWKGMVNNLKNLKPICLLSCFFSLFFYVMLLGLISLICLIS